MSITEAVCKSIFMDCWWDKNNQFEDTRKITTEVFHFIFIIVMTSYKGFQLIYLQKNLQGCQLIKCDIDLFCFFKLKDLNSWKHTEHKTHTYIKKKTKREFE